MSRRSSIRERLRTAILLPTAIAVAFSCAVFVFLQWRSSLADHEQRLSTLAHVIGKTAAPALAYQNDPDAVEILRTLASEPAVRNAALYNTRGQIVATYVSPDASRPIPVGAGQTGLQRESGRLAIFHPVADGDRVYGTLFIRWDLRPWYAEMRTYIIGALGVLAACILTAVLVGDVLQRNLARPILELAATADAIAQRKDYSLRTPIPDTAELSLLANAFNEMLRETQQVQAKLAEEIEATRRAEQQLRLVTDAIPGLVSYVDTLERYRFVNRQYETWLKRTREDVIGRTMTEVLGEAAVANLRPHFQRALQGGAVEFETEVAYGADNARWVHVHYIPHRTSDNAVAGVFVLVIDLTERKRMEQSLARAHADLERHSHTLESTVHERTARMREVIGELEAFSYSIAHDMRAPLRSMQGFSRLLIDEHAAALSEEGKSYLRRIVASADRLDRLIQDVLNYSRVVRQDLRMEFVDTNRLIEEIIATYPNLHNSGARIELANPIPPVWANPAALTQVVSNLLGNAVKFVPRGTRPHVRITAERLAANGDAMPWVRLSVADNGIGIPKDAQHRLFAMFQRLHRPELFEGTGMGLAIVRKAIERMGGRIGVDSEEGRGSRFWIDLKAEQPK